MKKYQALNLITAGEVTFVLWLLYYTYYQGIIDDPTFYLVPPSIFIAFFLTQLMFIFLSTEDEEKAAIISVVMALVTILITFGALLAMPSKITASKELTEVVISKLIDCQKYIDCPNNPCSGEHCKKMGFIFYYNDEQIANAIKKYNKNLLDQEKIEQSKKTAEKEGKEADKRKAEELDKKLNTMLK